MPATAYIIPFTMIRSLNSILLEVYGSNGGTCDDLVNSIIRSYSVNGTQILTFSNKEVLDI